MYGRIFLVCGVLAWVGGCRSAPADGGGLISEVTPRYMETAQFQYVGEFFTGREVEDNRILLRSQAKERDGLYLIVSLKDPASKLPPGTRLHLEMIRSDSAEMTVHEFSIPREPAKAREMYIGLTGDDWPDPNLRPVAWRLRLLEGERVIAEWPSFLWEMP